jgi:hypothetical protein
MPVYDATAASRVLMPHEQIVAGTMPSKDDAIASSVAGTLDGPFIAECRPRGLAAD